MSTDTSEVVAQIKGMSRSDLEQFGTELPPTDRSFVLDDFC